MIEKMNKKEQIEIIARLLEADDDFLNLVLGIMDLKPNIQLAIDDLVKACNEE